MDEDATKPPVINMKPGPGVTSTKPANEYIGSDEEEAPENQETDVFILNILDEEIPFNKETLDILRRYISAFFGIPLQVVQTPATPVSTPGILALAEKTNRPLKQRMARLEEHKCKSTRISHLLECLREQKANGGGLGPFPDCIGVLGITSGELFEDDTELLPGDPAPEERVYKYGFCRPDLGISVLSLAHLTPPQTCAHTWNLKRPGDAGLQQPHRYRMYIRNLLKGVSHFLLKLLGYTGCQNQRCLLYRQPFKPDAHHMFLCGACEIKYCESMWETRNSAIRFFRPPNLHLNGVDFGGVLIKKQAAVAAGRGETRRKHEPVVLAASQPLKRHYFPDVCVGVSSHTFGIMSPSGSVISHAATTAAAAAAAAGDLGTPNAFFYAEKRFEEMSKALTRINTRIMYLQYQMRLHREFDREIEWLNYALHVYRAKLCERHEFTAKNNKQKVKRRSLERLLHTVHNETPTIEVLHRTFEEPFLKIRCLADMRNAGPFQTPVPSDNAGYAWVYFNKRHSTGGVFLETAGSLNPKKVGNFPTIGVNAQISNSIKPF